MYCWYLYFAVRTILLLYSVALAGSLSNMCNICLYLLFFGLPHVFSLIDEFFNKFLCQTISKIHKSIIRLEEIFHLQICIHFSAGYEKSEKLDGPPSHSPYSLQPNLVFIHAIMYQVIVIAHCPPASLIIRNKFKMIDIDYIYIHHPSLFLLNLHHSHTQKGLHHHNILIRLL